MLFSRVYRNYNINEFYSQNMYDDYVDHDNVDLDNKTHTHSRIHRRDIGSKPDSAGEMLEVLHQVVCSHSSLITLTASKCFQDG